MKNKRTLNSARLAGKACLVKKSATDDQKASKRKKKLKIEAKPSSILNLVHATPCSSGSSKRRKKMNKSDAESPSVEELSSGTEAAESPFHPQTSFAPLVIDVQGNDYAPPAFSLADVSFETPCSSGSSKRRKKMNKSDAESPSVEELSSGTEAAESPFHPQTSFAPLIIDVQGNDSAPPAFSLADVSFETSDAEVVVPRVRKGKQTKRRRRSASSTPAPKRHLHCTSSMPISPQNRVIKLFPVKEWDLLIAVLPHPTRIKFLGTKLIQVFSGSVNILGYVLEDFQSVQPVYCSTKLMPFDIKTEHTASICRQTSRLQNVKNILVKNNVPDGTVKKILDSCDNSSVIVGFRKNLRCSDVYFVSKLMPNVFSLKTKEKDLIPYNFEILQSEGSSALEFPECRNFFSDVTSCIKDCVANGIPAPRIIVQGNKGLGKSTLLRYTINRILNEFDAVYYLDGDPGQSEFTPAGCVSLVKVSAPLLGPPFTHQTTPEKMYFLGTVSIREAEEQFVTCVEEQYVTCVQLLTDYYNKNCAAIPLFVNTMGWVTGIGLELLKKVKTCVVPTHVVEIVDNKPRGSHSRAIPFGQPIHTAAKEFTYGRFSRVDEVKHLMNPAERRDLSILAYLGKCQRPYGTVCPFNSIIPYRIAWKDLALYIGDQRDLTEHMLYSLNATWIALLSVDESLIMTCEEYPELPKLLSGEPTEQECFGFGVVRNIDYEKKVFYIVTPEPEDRLKKVNAIMKKDVQLPYVLFTSQDTNKCIPYVTQVIGEQSVASKHVSRRKFRPSRSQMEDFDRSDV